MSIGELVILILGAAGAAIVIQAPERGPSAWIRSAITASILTTLAGVCRVAAGVRAAFLRFRMLEPRRPGFDADGEIAAGIEYGLACPFCLAVWTGAAAGVAAWCSGASAPVAVAIPFCASLAAFVISAPKASCGCGAKKAKAPEKSKTNIKAGD